MSLKEKLHLSAGAAYLINATDILHAADTLNNGTGDTAQAAVAVLQDVLVNLLQHDYPEFIAVCFDTTGKSFRGRINPAYQQNSLFDSILLDAAVAEMKKYLQDNQISHFAVSDYEAIDCIASIAELVRQDRDVAILGTDRRLFQCLADGVCVWNPFADYNDAFTLDKFMVDVGVTPERWTDFYALNGDLANNIPDYLFWGSAKVKKVLTKCHSLSDLFSFGQLDALTNEQIRRVNEVQADLLDSKKIATLQVGILDSFAISDIAVLKPNLTQRRCMFPYIPPYAAGAYIDETSSSSEVVYEELQSVMTVEELPNCSGKRVAVLLNEQTDAGCNIVAVEEDEYAYAGDVFKLAGYVKHAKMIVVLDLKEVLVAAPSFQEVPLRNFCDLRLAAHLLDSSEKTVSWSQLVYKAQINSLPTRQRGVLAIKLASLFIQQLEEKDLIDWMFNVDLPLRKILLGMEQVGFSISASQCDNLSDEICNEVEAIRHHVYGIAGKSFDISSNEQLGTVLYDELKLRFKGLKKRPSSVDAADLKCLVDSSGIVDTVIEIRELGGIVQKIKSLKNYIQNGQIGTKYNQTGSETGRIYSSGYNLQALPKRTKGANRLRQCFKAADGKILVSADYSQAELRVLAHYSLDPLLLKFFQERGGDVYTWTAAQIYGRHPHSITPEERRNAKEVALSVMNGMGATRLAQKLGVNPKKAKGFVSSYLSTFSMVKKLKEKVIYDCRRDGGVYTMAGRFRSIENINSPIDKLRFDAERKVLLTLQQGAVADILRCAMCNVVGDDELTTMGARLMLQLHDELILEVPEENASRASALLCDCMTQIELCKKINFLVPLDVNVSIGKNLGNL